MLRGGGFQLYETPLLKYGLQIETLPQGICGTGDSFKMSHTAHTYNVVDMEACSLAFITQKENIPFLGLKYISDSAAADNWNELVHKAAAAFGTFLFAV